MSAVKITQIRSVNGANPNQQRRLQALGLGRIGKTAERKDTPQLQGQLRVVGHLVEVEMADGGARRRRRSTPRRSASTT